MAFCFYNLSSIINGLVYFDQFSALSTMNLLLVMLGMVVLLAGVWVVSFPPGGNRGIDLGAWGEPEEIAMDTESDFEDIPERYEDEPLPMAGAEAGERGEFNLNDELDEGRRSESPTRILRIATQGQQEPEDTGTLSDRHSHESPTSIKSSSHWHTRRQTDSALLSSQHSQYGVAPNLNFGQQHQQSTPPRRHRPLLHGASPTTSA